MNFENLQCREDDEKFEIRMKQKIREEENASKAQRTQ